MPKTIDTEDVLPCSWELRSIRPHRFTPTETVAWQSLRRFADVWLDISFTARRVYRHYKNKYGYAFGPIVVGVPACAVWAQLMRAYSRRLQAGRIRYRYHAPECARLPPPGFENTTPWTEAPIDSPRGFRASPSHFFEKEMEAGSRFQRMHRPAWQQALLRDASLSRKALDSPATKLLR